MVVTYNTDMVAEADVPARWRDIADPKWRGKILLTDPRTSETYLGWLAKMERAVGADFVQALAKQQFTIIASGASGAQMIAAGAFPINLPTYASFGIVLKSKNAPINSRIMRDPIIVSESSVGVAAHARHPNAARLFANFLLADETLRALCKAYPISTPGDPDGRLGCIGLENPQLVDYVPEQRKIDLVRMIGLESR
jgi:iron(III) transport system substrate-binding protein